MYNEIIEKIKPHLKTLVDEHFQQLIYAFNLHCYALEEYGGCGDDSYIFDSDVKDDVKKALDIMGTKEFYKMIQSVKEVYFYFDKTGKILSPKDVENILFDNFEFYMYETLAEPWHSTETQELYKKIWDIVVLNNTDKNDTGRI